MAVKHEHPDIGGGEFVSTEALRGKRHHDDEMDITPMIDVVFLLLIFFLVASRIDDSASVTIPNARHGGAVQEKDSVVIIITKASGDKVNVARGDGTDFTTDDLEAQEEEIIEYVKAGLAGTTPFDKPKTQIMIKAAKGIRYGEVARVKEAVGKVEDVPQILNLAVKQVQ